jgi:thiol:disulfide interchange protein DsbD
MKVLINLCLLLWTTQFVSAQEQKVSWDATIEKSANEEYTLVLKGEIEYGWYLYSQYLENDEGPIPTKVYLEELEGLEKVGKAEELGEKIEGYDAVFMMNVTKYKENITIRQKLNVPAGTAFFTGSVEFMTCDDEQCLPPTQVEFAVELE